MAVCPPPRLALACLLAALVVVGAAPTLHGKKRIHDLKAPTSGAPLTNDVKGGLQVHNKQSVMSKVIHMINTHTTKHTEHKQQLRLEPVCDHAPAGLRFCAGVSHKVYRHSKHVAFDTLDYNAHKVFKAHVEHMTYTREQVGEVEKCKLSFKDFLCDREFPHCCDIRVCGAYGPPALAATGAFGHPSPHSARGLVKKAKHLQQDAGKLVGKHNTATSVTFLNNGSMTIDRDNKADNKTVLVKLQNGPCLYYNTTFTPLYDCLLGCQRVMTASCQEMLHTSCAELCNGFENPGCATKHLLAVVHHDHGAAPPNKAPLGVALAVLLVLLGLLAH